MSRLNHLRRRTSAAGAVGRELPEGAPIDAFGVGTRMDVAADAPYLDMAYKLVEYDGRPVLKTSAGKATWAAQKQVYRLLLGGEEFLGDVLALREEPPPPGTVEILLRTVMARGRLLAPHPALTTIREYWGFRKVRKRVYKGIARRIQDLGLSGLPAYRAYLELHAAEWSFLDSLCRIPISRFYRDRGVFQCLEEEVLPGLGRLAAARGDSELACWSIGCASGEEPYTLAIVWRIRIAPRFPGLGLRVLATDVDTHALERARRGCYGRGSLKDLPADLLARAFTSSPQGLCLNPEYREGVELCQQDVRLTMPPGPFHLVFCRNLAFTYFEAALQREVLGRITERLCPGGRS